MTIRNLSQAAEGSQHNSRKTLSKRIPRIGKVVFSPESGAVHCTVKEFSTKGAVITMSGWLGLPSSFSLYVEPDSIHAQCRVRRRKGNNIEVEFTSVEEQVRFRNLNSSVHAGATIPTS